MHQEFVDDQSNWVDKQGIRYTDDEVIEIDIDTMGPQFMGFITKKSFDSVKYIDQWIRVYEIPGRVGTAKHYHRAR